LWRLPQRPHAVSARSGMGAVLAAHPKVFAERRLIGLDSTRHKIALEHGNDDIDLPIPRNTVQDQPVNRQTQPGPPEFSPCGPQNARSWHPSAKTLAHHDAQAATGLL